ncbi:MAG: ComF family protein [Gammaproteobacteria bacterium]
MGFRKVDEWLGLHLPRWPCELCGAAAGSAGICGACRAELPWIGAACRQCARPLERAGHCDRCCGDTLPWTRAVAPLAWAFPVDALISRYKYGGALHFGALLGRLLADSCDGPRPDGVVPVPLHPARLAERGFNQARELARPLARVIGVPILERACCRRVATPPQAGLTAQQRYRNLRGAFAASSEVRGLRLAIVDDVLTTGSTAAALSRALLRAGAMEVEIWAVARGGTAQAGVKV